MAGVPPRDERNSLYCKMKSFLSEVADELHAHYSGSLTDIHIIFPPGQRRAIEVLRSLFDAPAPRMLTITRLFGEASGLREAPAVELLFPLYASYCRVCDGRGIAHITMDEFMPWGEMMLSDFDDVDKCMVSASSIFREAKSMKEITSAPFADESTISSLKKYFSTFEQAMPGTMRAGFRAMWDMLSPIYDDFREHLGRATYEGAIYRAGCRRMVSGEACAGRYAFVGFNRLSEAERRIMLHLKAEGRADFFWDYTPGFVDSDSEAVATIADNYKTLGGHIASADGAEETPVSIVESPTRSGQAAYAASWLHAAGEAGGYTAIVMPDEAFSQTLRWFLPRSGDGTALPAVPMAATATYSALRRAEAEALKEPATDAAAFADAMEKAATDAAAAADSPEEAAAAEAARRAAEHTRRLLRLWPDAGLSARGASDIFRKICADEGGGGNADAPTGEGRRLAEVISLGDTRTVDYDNVLILDCNEGRLPGAAHTPTMLPRAVRRAYGLPLPEANAAVAAYNLFRLLRRTPRIALAYTSAMGGMGGGEMSRFLLQIEAGETQRSSRRVYLTSRAGATPPAPQPVEKTEEMLSRIQGLEATPLYMYTECPLKFYYNKVCSLRAPLPRDEKMPPHLFGTIFHDAMQHYYQDKPSTHIETSTIRQDLDDAASVYLGKCIRTAFAESEAGENEIIRGIILKYMRRMLEYDARQAPFDIMPEYIEKFIYTEVTTLDGRKVRVGGRFDRVHKKDGVYVVADYKTGRWSNPVAAKSLSEAFSKADMAAHSAYVVQTMLYSLALADQLRREGKTDAKIRPELYFITGIDREDFSPLVRVGGVPVDDFAMQEAGVRGMLQGLTSDIFSLGKPFSPAVETKACDYCDYAQLCRK